MTFVDEVLRKLSELITTNRFAHHERATALDRGYSLETVRRTSPLP